MRGPLHQLKSPIEFIQCCFSPVKDEICVNDRWGMTMGKHGGFFNYADQTNAGKMGRSNFLKSFCFTPVTDSVITDNIQVTSETTNGKTFSNLAGGLGATFGLTEAQTAGQPHSLFSQWQGRSGVHIRHVTKLSRNIFLR